MCAAGYDTMHCRLMTSALFFFFKNINVNNIRQVKGDNKKLAFAFPTLIKVSLSSRPTLVVYLTNYRFDWCI